ncbi:hypothetical protein VB712_07030 [Spirulina sp. CCNP1310]|uniref:hypothetical protein n=1 Tax=Spirulina sp. CCNP1310 TaxID=3110249 RepID=UPI002B20449E|nr:hypothetical protein [Spirulina sp. CCNP1310]MEA5418977.1 hypothetical protein [Spirulina sp. CCNP1310]
MGSLATLGTESEQGSAVQWAIWILGLVATVVIVVYTTKIARAALANQLGDDPASKE